MKNFLSLSLLILVCFFISNQGAYGQSSRLKYKTYVFPSDSLAGFDEMSANSEALTYGFFGTEYKVYMYRAKRNFINNKYIFIKSHFYIEEIIK